MHISENRTLKTVKLATTKLVNITVNIYIFAFIILNVYTNLELPHAMVYPHQNSL